MAYPLHLLAFLDRAVYDLVGILANRHSVKTINIYRRKTTLTSAYSNTRKGAG